MKNINVVFVWIITLVVSMVVFTSCSLDPVDKTYSKHTAEDDYRRIREISRIDTSDALLLGEYMVAHGYVGSHVLELHSTYKDILNEAKREKEKYEIEKKKKNGNKEIDIAKSHEVAKIVALKKILFVDFVKEIALEPETNELSKKWKKPAAPENKNIITYNVLFKNIGDKGIQAFKGEINFYDVFHSEIKKVSFSNFRQIAVGDSIVQKFTINLDEVNKSGNIYNDLKKDYIKVEWLPDRLIQDDDTVIE